MDKPFIATPASVTTTAGVAPNTGYRPELDGVRAVAISLVLIDHDLEPILGLGLATVLGSLGVMMFFVLSGYLITGILVAERERTGTIRLRAFYARRFARLAPALLLVIAFVSLTRWYHDWQIGVIGALTYSTNLIQAFGYDTGPMTHAWSLAVEEHFYALWPLVLAVWPGRARWVALVMIAVGLGIYATSGWTAMYSTPGAGVALMIGSLLALRGVGSSRLRALSPVGWLGRRAYSLYLWNFPLVLYFGNVGGTIATFAVAELSYRLVERPIVTWWRKRSARPSEVALGAPYLATP